MSVETVKQNTLSNIQQKVLEIFTEETDRAFLIDSTRDRELTFGEVYNRSLAVATLLRRKGIEPGDRVIYVLPNCYEFAVLYMASLLSGVTVVPVSPAMPPRDIEFIAQHCRAKMIFTADQTMPQVASFINGDMGMDVMYLEQGDTRRNEVPDSAEILDLDALSIPADELISPFEDVSDQQHIAIVYTSGTTSRPKGVAHTASSMLNNALRFTSELEISRDNRFYGILAMGYLGGYYNLLMLPFMARSSVVIARAFDARSPLTFWDPAEKYGVNTLWVVPTIMAIMLKVDRSEKGPQFCRKEVKRAIVGTAPLPRKLKQDFEDHYGVKLYENYGLSETFFISTEAPKYPLSGKSIGRILPEVEVSVVSGKGEPLPYGSEGEILVKTPFLMQGYYDPERGEPDYLDRGANFPTGDVGYLTESGELFITGRQKDLIIKGGINISPMAIEDILHEHEAVEAAAVVGAPHEIYGEDVVAAIKLKEGYAFEEEVEKIKDLCQQNLASNQRPSFFFEIDDFPRSAAGKIQKAKVKELVLAKFGLKEEEQESPDVRQIDEPVKKKLMVASKVRRDIKRPSKELIERIGGFPTSIISDCLNRLRVMDNCIQPVVKGRSFAGPAFTVEEVEGGNLMSHIALEIIQSGDVLVIDAKGTTTRSCWGGLQTYAAKEREVSGIVIFGSVRDYEEIAGYDIPVYAAGVSPGGPLKGWGGFVNYPISCGGVPVLPGDVVVGDDDGIVVVPPDFLEEILAYCEERIKREEKWYKDVEQGISTIETVGLRKNVEGLDIEFL